MSELSLIPEPQKLKRLAGSLAVPRRLTIGIGDQSLYESARAIGSFFGPTKVHILDGQSDFVRLDIDPKLDSEAYELSIRKDGIELRGRDPRGVAHGAQTLRQIVAQSPGRLPLLSIQDWPDFCDRGQYYDLSRGRVPHLESLLQQAELLARFKMNHLELYIEHTFRFRRHPRIGRGASPLSAEDILKLDAHCQTLGVELVPSLASFGHLSKVLVLPEYRELAEDWGVGRYLSPEVENVPSWKLHRGWTLSPSNPKSYEFLDSLFAEFLPLFSSKRFNVCCDETWDLGLGQSFDQCAKLGKGRVYLNHIQRLNQLCRKYGKRMMFWGDIIRNYPDLIAEVPRDVTVLDWGYDHSHPFDNISAFAKAGLEFLACPGTSSWVSLFPRLPEAVGNISGFTRAAKKFGARGILNTDWGDGGHYNFMELSWHGYGFAAEQSWNGNADQSSYNRRFAKVFLGSDDSRLVDAIETLGDVSHLKRENYYQSLWLHVFFAKPGDAMFTSGPAPGWTSKRGQIQRGTVDLTSAFGTKTHQRLGPVRAALERALRQKGADPHGVLP
ncbi:MAG TPA: glycoside hydrolase family 20 zincin-like fold domain-containing protein, partial [Polyangiaceae bacterium]